MSLGPSCRCAQLASGNLLPARTRERKEAREMGRARKAKERAKERARKAKGRQKERRARAKARTRTGSEGKHFWVLPT